MAKTNFGSKNVQEKYFDSKIAKNYCMARKRLMIFSSQKLAKILQAGKGWNVSGRKKKFSQKSSFISEIMPILKF